MIGPNESSNADRLDYLYLNLVGQMVQIHLIDGALCEGLFVSRTDADGAADEAGVFISYPRFLASKQHDALEASELSDETRLFRYEDIMMMEAKAMKLRTETPGSGHVYTYRGDHDLKTLDWAAEGADDLLDTDSHVTGQWDQFAANAKFGVRTSYNEDLYTTKLDESKLSKEQIAYAERTAKEIENSGTRNLQHRLERSDVANEYVDEGALFSDVTRDARGSKRTAQATRKEAAAAASAVANSSAAAAAQPSPTPPANVRSAAARHVSPPVEEPVAPPPPPPEANQQNKTTYSPNPSATPFVPLLKSFLANVAAVVSSNSDCFRCPTDWPGDVDFYDRDVSHYSRQQQPPPQQQNMHHKYHQQPMNPMPNRGPINHHQQHHVMPNPMTYNNSPGPMGGPHVQPQHMQYMDPGNNGMMPPHGPGPMSGPSSNRMQPQRTAKTSQPQQPVQTASQPLPPPPPQQQQQQQQQPPPPQQQQQAVPAIDSTSPQPERATTGAKKLRRGGMASAARQESGDSAPVGKKGAK
ncbi:putative mitochondrial PAB1-binding protein [Leptomonas pyrrhocoris]|uniref:Putative mitochondrial PAB1-binding protein n=1 Tax=Leptomonas pyrrhocoris TaxID=157538 RepID=A0A0M9FU89_LEPPY|nr:putative mitochondrial PAB1-binding protein [Leptomonas pyrrhocoris]KPA76059.1 putative mitochondrial PAB1-binding protein [Leptomonas pyrrhocoris]|eukprot:XP_015654498.1 putative mitochondrial PAB1-binding protein [Leptomonas pyrrhocoris]